MALSCPSSNNLYVVQYSRIALVGAALSGTARILGHNVVHRLRSIQIITKIQDYPKIYSWDKSLGLFKAVSGIFKVYFGYGSNLTL